MKKVYYLYLLALVAMLAVACGPTKEDDDVLVVQTEVSATQDDAPSVDSDGMDVGASGDISGNIGAPPATLPPPTPLPTIAPFEELTETLKTILPAYDDADVVETENGLRYVMLEEGEGETPNTCDTIEAHYTGYLIDGTVFDSSREADQTLQFPLGTGGVIKGWDEGFALMKPGAKAILMIPPALAYGIQPPPGSPIAPNSTLYFDVELVDVVRVDENDRPSEEAYTTELDSGVKYVVLEEGSGEAISGDQVMVLEFTLWEPTGCVAVSTAGGNGNIAFEPGGERMFSAMVEGAEGMKLNEVRQMFWPAAAIIDSGLQPLDYTIRVQAVSAVEPPPATFTEIAESDFMTTTTGVKYAEITAGAGITVAQLDTINTVYHVWSSDGEQLSSSVYSGDESIPYILGSQQIVGWDEALADAEVGSVRQIFVPAELAGAAPGQEPLDIIFEVEIVSKGILDAVEETEQ